MDADNIVFKEPKMKMRITFAWSFILLASFAGALAYGGDAPKTLPDQYAEAVLDVEGMI